MTAAGLNATDMFPETFSEPCGKFQTALSDPLLEDKIAKIRCYYALSPHLRGDGKAGCECAITYGLPGLFSIGISHPQSGYLAELAGISPPKKTLGVRYTPPCEIAIAAAMKRIHAALVKRLTAAAAIPFEELNP